MGVSPEKASHRLFRYHRFGVYDVAYEDSETPMLRIYSLLDSLCAISQKMPAGRRLLADALKIAPAAFIVYMVTAVWWGVRWAVDLYCMSTLFDRLGDSLVHGTMSLETYPFLVIPWICCTIVETFAKYAHAQSNKVLITRFRAYIIPQMIRASLKFDVLSIKDLLDVFPVRGHFASEFPGRRFLMQLSQLVEETLNLTCQVFMLVYVISRKQSPEREILFCFCIARGIIMWLAPPNCIGSPSYVYWPRDLHFQRMRTLYGLAFTTGYRADVVLDGIAGSIESEYNKSAELMGDADDLEPVPWVVDLSPGWYWGFLSRITLENHLAIYALIYSAYPSPPPISSIMLLQHIADSVLVRIWRGNREEAPSVMGVCASAKHFYDAIDYKSTMYEGTEPYPRSTAAGVAYDAGMKISFRDVSLRYPGGANEALHQVSFNILPGQLVLVVGANGSGKSTMLKLLARLFDPTEGKVWVDDVPVERFKIEDLRGAMVFQAQVPAVYPGSVWDNIACNRARARAQVHSADVEQSKRDEQARVEAAAMAGSCAEWIARLSNGYETKLQPSFDIDNTWQEGIMGRVSDALLEELARHRDQEASLSGGEKQRLATARTYMRLSDTTPRLVLLDEATSALDPLAERAILATLERVRAGKTIVLVAHRFHRLARMADRVLCMKQGSVVECGTHAELMQRGGEYAALYNAQVDLDD